MILLNSKLIFGDITVKDFRQPDLTPAVPEENNPPETSWPRRALKIAGAILVCNAVFILIEFTSGMTELFAEGSARYITSLIIDAIIGIMLLTGKEKAAKCIHGGAAFIMPVTQHFEFLDLTPIQIDIPLKGALSKQQIRVDVPSMFTVGISTEENIMPNAAERLLGLKLKDIEGICKEKFKRVCSKRK